MVEKEKLTRTQIEMSEEYEALGRVIRSAQEERESMFDNIENSAIELSEAKAEFMKYLQSNLTYENEKIERKYRIKKQVNPTKVLEVLHGDFGRFSELIKISQKDLKEYSGSDEDLQKSFKGCIDTISKELTDFKIIE